jgi:hypothetical protein
MFGYNSLVVDAMINELLFDRAIEHERGFAHVSNERLGISTRGVFILDRLVGNPEYISIATQSTWMPTEILDKGFFEVRAASERAEFVALKVINSIDFLRLVKAAESMEEKRFNIALGKEAPENYRQTKNGALVIYPTYKDRTLRAAFAILDRAAQNNKTEILSRVNSHFDTKAANF